MEYDPRKRRRQARLVKGGQGTLDHEVLDAGTALWLGVIVIMVVLFVYAIFQFGS